MQVVHIFIGFVYLLKNRSKARSLKIYGVTKFVQTNIHIAVELEQAFGFPRIEERL